MEQLTLEGVATGYVGPLPVVEATSGIYKDVALFNPWLSFLCVVRVSVTRHQFPSVCLHDLDLPLLAFLYPFSPKDLMGRLNVPP